MKVFKYLAMAVVGIALIGLTGCQKEKSALWKKGGEWNLNSIHYVDYDSDGNKEDEFKFENVGTVIFGKDGSFTANINILGQADTEKGSYVYENDKLTITIVDEGETDVNTFAVSREGNKMTLVDEYVYEDGSREVSTQVLERK